MAELDENPIPSQNTTTPTPSIPDQESDSDTDAPLDFRHLIPNHNHTLPRRGIKDFEYHGTNSQISVLEGSRQAMHDALSVGRVHGQKNSLVGYFDIDGPTEEEDTDDEEEGGIVGSWGRRGGRPVVIEKPSGQHIRTMGVADKKGGLWLLPEEVVYLVERGTLDVRYRVAGKESSAEKEKAVEDDKKEEETDIEDDTEGWNGISMSLQACYANFIGLDGLTLERYTVYASLKRSGYIVQRAPGWHGDGSHIPQSTSQPRRPNPQPQSEISNGRSLWQWLYTTLFEQAPRKPLPLGPLVTPGLYRNYSNSSPLTSLPT
ncbi:MAG: hypothetical protein Q9171_005329 [Xanthocarpia ochracea]